MNVKSDEETLEVVSPAEFTVPLEIEPPTEQEHSEDRSDDTETVPVNIGYGELDDHGDIKFSWRRLFVFAGTLSVALALFAGGAVAFMRRLRVPSAQ
jgi:hypothetical protein